MNVVRVYGFKGRHTSSTCCKILISDYFRFHFFREHRMHLVVKGRGVVQHFERFCQSFNIQISKIIAPQFRKQYSTKNHLFNKVGIFGCLPA